jgi:hypothetical protein
MVRCVAGSREIRTLVELQRRYTARNNMHSLHRSIGLPELFILFLIALILFGPRAFGPRGPFSG